MENRNNAQINPAGYFAKANVKINLLSTKIKSMVQNNDKKRVVREPEQWGQW